MSRSKCRSSRNYMPVPEQKNFIWKTDNSRIEIRTQRTLADGTLALDEVAKCAVIHLEQMSHHYWWMGIETDGKYFHLNFGQATIGRGRCREWIPTSRRWTSE